MKNGSYFVYFNVIYAASLVCFFVLFCFKIQNIFLTNFIIIISFILLVIKFLYWFSMKEKQKSINAIDKQKFFLFRLACCIFIYIVPVYCIIQEPGLIVSHYVSIITFIIVILLAILGICLERWLYFIESQQIINDSNA